MATVAYQYDRHVPGINGFYDDGQDDTATVSVTRILACRYGGHSILSDPYVVWGFEILAAEVDQFAKHPLFNIQSVGAGVVRVSAHSAFDEVGRVFSFRSDEDRRTEPQKAARVMRLAKVTIYFSDAETDIPVDLVAPDATADPFALEILAHTPRSEADKWGVHYAIFHGKCHIPPHVRNGATLRDHIQAHAELHAAASSTQHAEKLTKKQLAQRARKHLAPVLGDLKNEVPSSGVNPGAKLLGRALILDETRPEHHFPPRLFQLLGGKHGWSFLRSKVSDKLTTFFPVEEPTSSMGWLLLFTRTREAWHFYVSVPCVVECVANVYAGRFRRMNQIVHVRIKSSDAKKLPRRATFAPLGREINKLIDEVPGMRGAMTLLLDTMVGLRRTGKLLEGVITSDDLQHVRERKAHVYTEFSSNEAYPSVNNVLAQIVSIGSSLAHRSLYSPGRASNSFEDLAPPAAIPPQRRALIL